MKDACLPEVGRGAASGVRNPLPIFLLISPEAGHVLSSIGTQGQSLARASSCHLGSPVLLAHVLPPWTLTLDDNSTTQEVLGR